MKTIQVSNPKTTTTSSQENVLRSRLQKWDHPRRQRKGLKNDQHPKKRTLTEISQAIEKMHEIAKESSDEKPYDQFRKIVASELRLLPQRQAILLQQNIQNCIICFNLSSLEQQAPNCVESAHSLLSFPSTSASSLNDGHY